MKYKKYILIIAILLIVCIGIISHKNKSSEVQSGKINAVASFYPLYFFASQIGGDKVAVTNITPSGAEPHEYELTAQDSARIENSKLLILNGGGLEPWGDSIMKNIDPSRTTIVTAGEALTTEKVVEEGETIADPHIWLSPILVEQMIDTIAAGFVKVDTLDREYFESNAKILKNKLSDLDKEYTQGLSACSQKNIITSHAAFGYLAKSYGLHQVAISGLSPDAEPSPQDLAKVAQFAKNNTIKYIFFESLVSPKLSETIAAEIGAHTMVLNPIEGLTKDEIASGKDYLSEMRSNLSNLRIALECK